jgi:hypothetical protein
MCKEMSYLTFFENTRQGEAARDPDMRRGHPITPGTPSGCGNGWATQSVAGNPGLIGRGNYGNSPEGGCGIDIQTELLFGLPGTSRQPGPKQSFARPWATTPNLGKGSVEDIPDENKVKFGHSTANRKSIQTVTDKQFPVFAPLIPELLSDFSEYSQKLWTFHPGGTPGYDKARRVDLSS